MTRIGLSLALALVAPIWSFAHNVPDEVRIRAFLKPEDEQMIILVRVPANALIDILFPTLPGTPWLDLQRAGSFAEQGASVWVADWVSLYEGDQLLPKPQVIAARLTELPDGSFGAFEKAFLHISRDQPAYDDYFTQDEAAVDVELQAPVHSRFSNFSIEPRFARLGVRVTTSMGFLPARGGIRQFEYEGDPGKFHLDPNPADAMLRSIRAGYSHFFNANDYLLFLLSVALIFQKRGELARFALQTVVSQSLAFLLAAFALWLSSSWAEAVWGVLVSAAVLYMAFEAIVRKSSGTAQLATAVVTGFIFGTGYWFAFRPEMQFAGTHKLASVLAFDIGIQVAQLGFLIVAAAGVLLLLRTSAVPSTTTVICAAIVLRFSWHRMLDRARRLSFAPVVWPTLTQNDITIILALLLALAGSCAYAFGRVERSRVCRQNTLKS